MLMVILILTVLLAAEQEAQVTITAVSVAGSVKNND
jgi:hypothetical protein